MASSRSVFVEGPIVEAAGWRFRRVPGPAVEFHGFVRNGLSEPVAGVRVKVRFLGAENTVLSAVVVELDRPLAPSEVARFSGRADGVLDFLSFDWSVSYRESRE